MKKGIFLFVAVAVFALNSFGQEKAGLTLTLEDSIVRALKNNLNLAVQVYTPELAGESLSKAKEFFLPTFGFGYNNQKNQEPAYSFLQGQNITTSRAAAYNAQVVQQIPTGGNISLSLSNDRYKTNESFQLINPRYGSTLRLDFNQPLLKNFGPKISRREIIVAQNNLDISHSQLKAAIMDTIYQVQEAYWNLVYSIENLKVNQQSLELARDLLTKNKKEVEVGTLAPLEVLNAEAAVAQREADILQAQALVKRAEDVLKSMINLPAEGDLEFQNIIPVEKPGYKAATISLDEALKMAMDKRPDLAVTRTTIETKRVGFVVAKNQILPQLDLQLSYWSPGISGDRLKYLNNDPFTGIIVGKEKNGPSKAFRDASKFLYENWNLGLTLTVPIGDVLGKANYALASLDLEQSRAQLKSQEQQVYLEVRDAVRSVETDAKRVDAYRIARELAEKRLEAETKKLGVGLTTNYFVLQYQEQLANAQSMEIKAIVDYNLSQARLDKAIGSSMENRNISLADFSR